MRLHVRSPAARTCFDPRVKKRPGKAHPRDRAEIPIENRAGLTTPALPTCGPSFMARKADMQGEPSRAEGRGAGRRRPFPRCGAAQVRHEADPGRALYLISRECTPYSGMLPGLVAGSYSVDEAHIDTGPLTRFAGARLYQDEVVDLDLAGRRVICRGRPPVPYDLLSLNIGSTPNTADVPGASEHAIPVKPIDGLPVRRPRRACARARGARVWRWLAPAPAGSSFCSLERRWREVTSAGLDAGGLSFVLISGAPEILPSFPAAFQARFHSIFATRGIGVFTGAAVTRVEAGRSLLDGHAPIEAEEILWTTQAAPARWLAKSGLPLDQRGFSGWMMRCVSWGATRSSRPATPSLPGPRPAQVGRLRACVQVRCSPTISAGD